MSGPAIAPPLDLTCPVPGSTTARAVVSGSIRRLLGDLANLPRIAPETRELTSLVLAQGEVDAGALVSALRRPVVATLLRCLRAGGDLGRVRRIAREVAALLAFELALAEALPRPIRLSSPPERLLSLSHRLALRLPEATHAITFRQGGLVVESASGHHEIALEAVRAGAPTASVDRPYHVVERGIVLALVDNSPLAMVEDHPDKAGNAVDLGGREPEEWIGSLRTALGIIERHTPALRDDLDLVVEQIVPVGFDAERHLSASYQEALGTIYLSLHPNAMTMAEAIVHEASHGKLNALFDLDPVLENADGLYASPVRPDPRPLRGVLLAVHAFFPVAALYESMIAAGDPLAESDSFRARYAEVCAMNHEGVEVVLANARPTPVGEGLIAELRRLDEHFMRA